MQLSGDKEPHRNHHYPAKLYHELSLFNLAGLWNYSWIRPLKQFTMPLAQRRRFHTNSKKNKKVGHSRSSLKVMLNNCPKQLPETASDFLTGTTLTSPVPLHANPPPAGIEYEESGDRWRPGDKPKVRSTYIPACPSIDNRRQGASTNAPSKRTKPA